MIGNLRTFTMRCKQVGGIHHKKEKGQPTLTSLLCLESSPSDKAGTGAIGTILPLDTLTLGRKRLQGN
jgi:hypothetical protein